MRIIFTILYYVSVHIWVQCNIIIFLHWHKYYAPLSAPMTVVVSVTYLQLAHLKIQYWWYQSVSHYCRSLFTTLIFRSIWTFYPIPASQCLPYRQAPQKYNFSEQSNWYDDPVTTPQKPQSFSWYIACCRLYPFPALSPSSLSSEVT